MSAIIFTLFNSTNVIEFDCTLSEKHESSAKATEHPVEEGANVTDHVRPELDVVQLEGVITNTPLNDVSVSRFLDDAGRQLKPVAPLRGTLSPGVLEAKTSQQRSTASLRGGAGEITRQQNGLGQRLPFRGGITPPLVTTLFGRSNERVEFVPGERETVRNDVSGMFMRFATTVDRVKEVYNVLQFLCTTGVEVKLVTDLREYPTMLITQLSSPRAPMDAMVFSMTLRQIRFAETSVGSVRLTKNVATKRMEKTTNEGAKPLNYVLKTKEADQNESWATQLSGSSNSQRNDFGD